MSDVQSQSEGEPLVIVEADGPVLTVTLNRPEKRNATNAEVLCRLFDAWVRLDTDPALRVGILTGKGSTFCAGMDLAEIGRLNSGVADNPWIVRLREDSRVIFGAFLKTFRPSKPIILAAEGYARAGGTEILQGTDIRVAGESAVFGVTEVQRGTLSHGGFHRSAPDARSGTPWRPRCSSPETTSARSERMSWVSSTTSFPMGRPCTAPGRSRTESPPMVRSPSSAILRTIRETEAMPEAEAFAIEGPLGMQVMTSNDAAEGPRAFLEKRAPHFTGT